MLAYSPCRCQDQGTQEDYNNIQVVLVEETLLLGCLERLRDTPGW